MDHVRLRCTVDHDSAAKGTTHRSYGSPAVAARGRGGRGGCGGVGGALAGDGAAMKRSGDGGKAVVIEGTRWG
jgi:hypothetical protein